MLTLLKKELDKHKFLNGSLPDILYRVAEAIPYKTIPDRMKYVISISEIMLFASQFRRNIRNSDGSLVPINTIGFVLTGSGQNKDSSVNAARKCFSEGYSIINSKREAIAVKDAVNEATEAGVDMPSLWDNYKEFYRAPAPLFVSPSTTEGFIQHLNDLEHAGIGSGFIYSGEFAAELASSPVFIDNLKLLSEVYDLGSKEVKVLKSRENQSKEIKNLPVSALLVSSPGNILYDEVVKKRFKLECSTKLARRGWFCYVPEVIKEETYKTIDDLISAETSTEESSIEARGIVSRGVIDLTEELLEKVGTPLEMDPDVQKLFIIYKRYNTELADTLSKVYPISILVRKHLQWKALKLSGAIAIFNSHDTITKEDYVQAIRFCELLDKDMQEFENELIKEPYEVFSDYIRSIAENGKAEVSLHNLKKMGFISTSTKTIERVTELAKLAASYDYYGVYAATDDGITYEEIVVTSTINITSKVIDNSPIYKALDSKGDKDAITGAKNKVAMLANDGLASELHEFKDLAALLEDDYAYSPFVFTDGVRSKENLVSKTKWLVLDIDDSTISDDEAHFLLSDINHHIVRGSDSSNEMKFHILVELDSEVSLDPITWKEFYLSIANELALRVDALPQSQIFFSYSRSKDTIQSIIDASPIAVREHLMRAKEIVQSRIIKKPLTSTQISLALSDPFTTFSFAYDCANDGSGSRKLLGAAQKAFYELGATKEETIELVKSINDFWVSPMSGERIENTLIKQIERWR